MFIKPTVSKACARDIQFGNAPPRRSLYYGTVAVAFFNNFLSRFSFTRVLPTFMLVRHFYSSCLSLVSTLIMTSKPIYFLHYDHHLKIKAWTSHVKFNQKYLLQGLRQNWFCLCRSICSTWLSLNLGGTRYQPLR